MKEKYENMKKMRKWERKRENLGRRKQVRFL